MTQVYNGAMTVAVVICLLLAVVLFVVAALGTAGGRLNLTAAGLAFFALAFLIPAVNAL